MSLFQALCWPVRIARPVHNTIQFSNVQIYAVKNLRFHRLKLYNKSLPILIFPELSYA